MQKIITLLFISLVPIFSFGQANLKGKIIDSVQNPLYGVNIILTDLDQNKISDGTITNEQGEFKFSKLEKGNYRINFSYLGFTSLDQEIDLNKDTDLGSIILTEDNQQLSEVVINVEKKKPLMEMKIDRTIFNVSQSDAAIGGNTVDALKITPGLKIKDADSEIEMVGKGSVKLMINDREIRLDGKSAFEYLKSIPSDQIESIEMITNPPSQYTAEGSYGIINIKLKKGAQDNFYGIISGSVSKAKWWSHNENLSFFYHKNNLRINAGGNYYKYKMFNSTQEKYFYPDYILDSKEEMTLKSPGYGAFLELAYDLSENTVIGGNMRYSKAPKNILYDEITNDYVKNNQIDSTLLTPLSQKQKTGNQNYSLYLDHKIDSSGSKLSTEVAYTTYKRDQHQSVATENPGTTNNFDLSSDNDQQIKLFYTALDFSLYRDFAHYDLGVQMSDSKNHNVALYSNPDLADQNSQFNYNESIYSAYATALKNFNEKWSLKIGLRAEYTLSKGNSLTLNQITKQKYFEFFPTTYLNYNLNPENDFTFSYGRRIDRPSYRALDPFRQYVSQFIYIEGNPYLRPAYNNNFEVKHLYKNKLSSAVYYSYTPNGYDYIDIVSEESDFISTIYDNYLKTHKFGITENYIWKPFKWWESDNTGQVYYSKSTSKNTNTRPELNGFGAYFNTNNALNLNKEKTLRANFSFTYYTPEVVGVSKDKTYYFMDLGVTALLFSKDLTVTLNANDIFKTALYRSNSEINGIPIYSEGYYDSRNVKLTASYTFGNSKNRKEREVYDENKERID